MEPLGPLDQLAMCCGLNRRSHRAGFDRAFQQQRNFYFSPSIAHMNAYASNAPQFALPGSWPLAGPVPFIQPQPQPYVLVTQPVIFATPQQQQQQQAMATNQSKTLDHRTKQQFSQQPLQQQQQQQIAQQKLISASRHMAIRAPMSSQYAICYQATQQQPLPASIYDSPRQLQQQQQLMRNQSVFMDDSMAKVASQQQQLDQSAQRRPQRALNAEIFSKLELIEKQVDLTDEMELVERHGIVITRAIDPYILMPHLTPETLRHYQTHFLMNDDYVIRFIEIIKRPGETLGLYIRTVQFENLKERTVREGLVVTKIESDSPIYTSQVLHVGDEILSINLINVQGMSLDDVVIIMSIPKRLVLALRIPKDRDQLLAENVPPPSRPVNQKLVQDGFVSVPLSQSVFGLGLSPGRLVGSHKISSPSNNDFTTRAEEFGASTNLSQMQSLQQQPLVAGLHFARPVRVQSTMGMNEILNEQKAELDDLDAELNFRAMKQQANPRGQLKSTTPNLQVAVRPASALSADGAHNSGLPMMMHAGQEQLTRQKERREQQQQQQNLPIELAIMSQLDRQMAISHSIEEVNACQEPARGQQQDQGSELQSVGTDRAQNQNISFNQELANLEREAMNKERPKLSQIFQETERTLSPQGHQSPSYAPQQHLHRGLINDNDDSSWSNHNNGQSSSSSCGNNINNNNNNNNNSISIRTLRLSGDVSNVGRSRISSTLPRRTLPTLPDENFEASTPSSHQIGLTSNPSTLRRPMINNIRLGATNEQSSYFSTSIDAINRELNELRRQRMALDEEENMTCNNNPGKDPGIQHVQPQGLEEF